MSCNNKKALETIGSSEYVDIEGHQNIPAKIDTGADSSSIWASHIEVDQDGVLHFQLFDKSSPYYTGEELKRSDFKAVVVRSSSGHEQIRYRTHLKATIHNRKIKVLFTLSNRSNNNYPVLIGRRTISGKFLVDVTRKNAKIKARKVKTNLMQSRLKDDPYLFHQQFIKNQRTSNDQSKGDA